VYLIKNGVLVPKSVLRFRQKRPPEGVCTRVIELVAPVDLEIERTLSVGRYNWDRTISAAKKRLLR
jgi:hypothetical protein